MSDLEAKTYTVRAVDEDGNVYEACVRAHSDEEAIVPLRKRGFVDAEARVFEGPLPAPEPSADITWESVADQVVRLIRSGRPLKDAPELNAAYAAQKRMEEAWRERTRPAFVLLGVLFIVLAVVWGATMAVYGHPSEQYRAMYNDFGIRLPRITQLAMTIISPSKKNTI